MMGKTQYRLFMIESWRLNTPHSRRRWELLSYSFCAAGGCNGGIYVWVDSEKTSEFEDAILEDDDVLAYSLILDGSENNVSAEYASMASCPQPPPLCPPTGKPVWPLAYELTKSERLQALMRARNEFGVSKYGVPLSLGDGRDASIDALQEALDLVVYLTKCSIESGDGYFSLAIQATKICEEILVLRDDQSPKVREG